MVYIVDIDGTICTISKDLTYEDSKPFEDRIEKLNKLYDEGHTILYNTARGMGRHGNRRSMAEADFYLFTARQLKSWGVKYHQLFLGKPAGDIYIDDKAMKDGDFFEDSDEVRP
jgi:hypothetical protein